MTLMKIEPTRECPSASTTNGSTTDESSTNGDAKTSSAHRQHHHHRPRPLGRYLPLWTIDIADDVIHAVIGLILISIAAVVLWDSANALIHARPFFPTGVISAINDVLFVIIILEILRTVTAHFNNGGLQVGPFLTIGIISAVRHILTVSASLTLQGDGTPMHFDHALAELGVNGGLVIALVVGLVLLHHIGDRTVARSHD
jgi:uncharacterized membrane protein (DUF373 family)